MQNTTSPSEFLNTSLQLTARNHGSVTLAKRFTCQDLFVTSLSDHEQMTLVNSLILDMGAIQGRIEAVLISLKAGDDHDSQMRAKAVSAFYDALLDATTRLRQDGLHPSPQGELW